MMSERNRLDKAIGTGCPDVAGKPLAPSDHDRAFAVCAETSRLLCLPQRCEAGPGDIAVRLLHHRACGKLSRGYWRAKRQQQAAQAGREGA